MHVPLFFKYAISHRSMGLIVQKYGGTSVDSPEHIRTVAQKITQTRQQGHSLIVVVSAMGHTTDELIALAHRVSAKPPHREMDMLLSTGERISMALLSMALAEQNTAAVSYTGSQSGIITDESHRCAKIRKILGDRVKKSLSEEKVVIVAGFQGVSESKEITTLGRGGSDTTAIALAAALGAEVCDIYTDVDGVYSADPSIVPDAKLLKKVSYSFMIEMSSLGAGVLHPRCVEMARRYGVKMRVKNSLNQNEGTEVVMEEVRVTGVTSDDSKILLKIKLMRATTLSSIWDQAALSNLTFLAPFFSDGSVRCFIERNSEPEWKKFLEKLKLEGFVQEYEFFHSLIPVSLVGSHFLHDGKALCSVLSRLSENGIQVTDGVASPMAITLAVPRNHMKEAVQCLHQKFVIES